MKKRLLLALAVVMSIAFVTTVFAQAPAATPEKKAVTEKAAVTDTKEVKAPATKRDKTRVKGELVSVDTAAKTIVVKSKKGEMTFDVANAKLGRGFTMENAKAGDKVVVGYNEVDGKMVAKYVGKHNRHHGKKHHKKATTEAKPAAPAPAPAPATPAK